jgi:PP-loop superfamily ATP-utilizing enzyme
VVARLRTLGYSLVTVDLNGYRRGPTPIALKPA